MAITSLDNYIASAKQFITLIRTAPRTSVATIPFTVFGLAGNPGAGVLAGTNTANGIVPNDTTVGCPIINPFDSGAVGYIASVEFSNTVSSRIGLYDILFKAGAYAFNANTILTAQPSYSSRVPDGTNFNGLQIWIETVTAFTGNQSIAVTYTNQSGITGRTTGTIATGVAPTVGRMLQLPLQAGDSGVQKIESVISTVSTAGTFNVLVLRALWFGRVRIANDADTHGLDKTGMPIIFESSALYVLVSADSTSTGLPELIVNIASL